MELTIQYHMIQRIYGIVILNITEITPTTVTLEITVTLETIRILRLH